MVWSWWEDLTVTDISTVSFMLIALSAPVTSICWAIKRISNWPTARPPQVETPLPISIKFSLVIHSNPLLIDNMKRHTSKGATTQTVDLKDSSIVGVAKLGEYSGGITR